MENIASFLKREVNQQMGVKRLKVIVKDIEAKVDNIYLL